MIRVYRLKVDFLFFLSYELKRVTVVVVVIVVALLDLEIGVWVGCDTIGLVNWGMCIICLRFDAGVLF